MATCCKLIDGAHTTHTEHGLQAKGGRPTKFTKMIISQNPEEFHFLYNILEIIRKKKPRKLK
jgi:hypothetical protein